MQKYLFAILSLVSAGPLSQAAELPNVILMMADDMGLGDTSAYQAETGNSDADQIATPNMERLARMGVRFTDAHTPSSRCSPTRYGLLTGRYPWRNRLKHFVLFGVQGDPMIEADRPTIGTLLQSHGYRTGLFGKWHVGLRYRQSDGRPAAAWEDADLTQPMADTPLDHGFDVCQFTSRSHGTSGLALGTKKKPNDENQSQGPGHIDGRDILSATGRGKRLHATGPNAYVLKELGGRHSDNAIDFVSQHVIGGASASQPFFVYYPSNSNHTPHTPDTKIGDVMVAGHSMNLAGQSMNAREDFVYENDIALGRLINFLEVNDDPRRPGHKLIENTIVVFTSDNGAEKPAKTATGPFRSNKGSCYEGGHRVPFIVAWKLGGVGDGDATTPGEANPSLICLTDMFATLSEVVGSDLPDLRAGEKGGEDSHSVLAAWRGGLIGARPMFYHDHKESKIDPAVCAMRLDQPEVDGQDYPGQWKILFDAALIRAGQPNPIELYELNADPMESENRVTEARLEPLVQYLCEVASMHRNSGGHRYREIASQSSKKLDFKNDDELRAHFLASETDQILARLGEVAVKISARSPENRDRAAKFNVSPNGVGISGGKLNKVDRGESIVIECDRDVIVESVSLFANNQPCGGFYQLGEKAPLAIYCIDADIDSRDQSGILSDIGILKAGEILELSSAPHLGVESPGNWRLESVNLREVSEP